MGNQDTTELKDWIPHQLFMHGDQVMLQWLYVGNQPFTDPFFDETISKCSRLPVNSKRYNCVCEISMLTEWEKLVDAVEPTAFIFHVSRCGSTLISQLLGIKEEIISLSEVPVFDEILRMPFKQQASKETVDAALPAAIKLYGRRRNGRESGLFIKTDSWHLLFYDQLRALYPQTPFILLYRQPAEVLYSQKRQKGMHAIRGVIEPAIFQFANATLNQIHYDDYMSLVLEKYYQTMIAIAGNDKRVLLVNYNEGFESIMDNIAGLTELKFSEADKEMFLERSRYHAKKQTETFVEKHSPQLFVSPNMDILKNLYEKLEALRIGV